MHYPKLIRSIIVARKLFLIKIKIISTTLPFFPNLYVEFSSDPNLSRKLPSNETPRSRIFILSLQNSSFHQSSTCSRRFIHYLCEKIPRENSIDGRFTQKKTSHPPNTLYKGAGMKVDLQQRVISILALN